MAQDLEYFVIPAEPLVPPSFTSDISPWGVGCLLMAAALFLSIVATSGASAGEGNKVVLVMVFYEVGAISIAIFIYNTRKESQLEAKRAEWMGQQIAERGKKARELEQQARKTMDRFYGGLGSLPGLLEAADMFLSNAEEEFQERAYAPFWDNIEQAALKLGAFNSSLARMESDAISYKNLLAEQVHNFPPLMIQGNAVPNPAPQADRLRLLVRMGQKDFEFATIWEHRKTQNVILEGFRTLGEAVNNLGRTIDDSFLRVTNTIEESSNKQLEEQVRLRGTFETALRKWNEQKRLNGM